MFHHGELGESVELGGLEGLGGVGSEQREVEFSSNRIQGDSIYVSRFSYHCSHPQRYISLVPGVFLFNKFHRQI